MDLHGNRLRPTEREDFLGRALAEHLIVGLLGRPHDDAHALQGGRELELLHDGDLLLRLRAVTSFEVNRTLAGGRTVISRWLSSNTHPVDSNICNRTHPGLCARAGNAAALTLTSSGSPAILPSSTVSEWQVARQRSSASQLGNARMLCTAGWICACAIGTTPHRSIVSSVKVPVCNVASGKSGRSAVSQSIWGVKVWKMWVSGHFARYLCAGIALQRKDIGRGGRDLHQPEERMMLDAALPQVLAGALRRRLEPVRALVVAFAGHAQHEEPPLEVDLGDARPVVVAHRALVAQHDDAARRQSEEILHVVLAEHRMQIDPVHFQPFDLVQVAELGLRRHLANERLVQLGDAQLQLGALIGQEPELGHVTIAVSARIEVAQLRLEHERAELGGQVEGDQQPPLQDVLLDLQEELVARDLLEQLARIGRVEFHAKVHGAEIVAPELSAELLVGVEPVGLAVLIEESEPEVGGLQQVQVLEDGVEQELAGARALQLVHQLGLVEEHDLAVDGGVVGAKAAHHCHVRLPPIFRAGKLIDRARPETAKIGWLCGSPASVYMAEVASVELRSVFTTWVSLFYAIGIFIVYLLGLIFKDDWGSIALIAAVFPLIGLLFLQLFIPESPPWLVTKQRFEEARTSMCRLHGTRTYTEDVQLEMETLLNNRRVKKEKTQQKTLPQQFVKKLKMLTRPNFLRPYRLVLAYFFFQQFTGIFAIMYYAIDIVKGAQVALDPHVAIVAIALVRLAGMVLISFLSTRLGRRTLGLASGVGIALSMLALGSYIVLLKRGLMAQPLPLVPLALLVFYFFITTIGFYPLPFALASEVYPKNIRGTAAGISTASTFVFNFVVVKLYPTMVAALGDFGVFYFYGGMGVAGTLFVLVCMPETKGRTLEEIQAYFVPPGAEPPEAKA
ncbi:hypothetical protein HUJ04_000280 [Dendroctonus ponderosae]|nr:hypothetical protein HUJ04_000280 [Dendroctonus ponderosae]